MPKFDPDAVQRETLNALARICARHAKDQHETAERMTDSPLRAAIADSASVLYSLTLALEQAAEGDGRGLDVLAAITAGWLQRQPAPGLTGLTLGELATTDPTHN